MGENPLIVTTTWLDSDGSMITIGREMGGYTMRRARRYALVGMLAALPLAASACRIPLGNGCDLLIAEPGTQIGVSCNVL